MMNDSLISPYPEPIPTPETEAFWKVLADEKFVLPWCSDCERHHWYPRSICPHCMSSSISLASSEGLGSVYSLTVVRLGKAPFVLAYVKLDEGPSLLTRLEGKDVNDWNIEDRVQVRFAPTAGELRVPIFGPVITK